MKIAYNPTTAAALSSAPNNIDVVFDLKGLNIFAKGIKFKGTDTTYSVFKKHTSSSGGGYNGLVPVPSYTTSNVRYLREDGTWQTPSNLYTYSLLDNTNLDTLKTEGKWYYISGGSNNTNGPENFNNGAELYIGRNAYGYRYLKVITAEGKVWIRIFNSSSWESWTRWYTDANTDNKVLLSATTTSNYRPLILGYLNSTDINSLANSTTNLVYATTKLYAQPSTGYLWALKLYSGGKEVLTSHQSLSNYVTINTALTITGQKTFSSDIHFSGTQSLFWNNGTYQQKISITDDAASGTSVFNFQQSTNSGSSWTNLLLIYDNGILHSSGYAKNGSSDSYVLLGGGGHKAVSDFATSASLGNYVTINTTQTITGLKTFSNPIISSCSTNTYIEGNKGKALINSTAGAGAYVMLFKGNSTNGYFTHGVYLGSYLLQYTAKSTVDAGTNSVTRSVTLLNESGNSIFPGTITATKFIGPLLGNADTATMLTSSAGSASLPIYFSGGKPVACTASSLFSNLSNSGNNISVTIAGQNRTLLVGYSSNSDKVDNRHAISTTPNTGIIYKAAIYTSYSLTSYWVRLASIPSINLNSEFIATIHVQSGHSDLGRSAILLVYLRGGLSSFLSKSFKICCNSKYDPNRFRLYYKDSDKTSEIWYQTVGLWDGIITTVISLSSEGSLYEGLTLYSGNITAVQTPSMSTYLSALVSTITDNISGNASTATKLQTARTINGTGFDGTANIITSYWGATRTISLTGAVTGSVSTNGSGNITINTTYGTGNITNLDSRYVNVTGDIMTGDLGLPSNRASIDGSAVFGGSINNISPDSFSNKKSIIGSFIDTSGTWYNIISIRHRNGNGDGNSYGMYIRSKLTSSSDLYWRLLYGTWQTEKILIDNTNYTNYVKKIGTSTVGSSSIPIYLNAGTPTLCNTTLGVSITGNAASATKLLTARTLWGQSFNGTTNVTGNMSSVGSINMSGDILISLASTTGTRLIRFTCGDNDYGRIAAGGTASNAGWLEIATADDANESIYVRQYSGTYTTVKRTLTLLDGGGNTSIPGYITSVGFKKSGSSDSYVLLGGGGHKAVNDFATASSLNNYVTLTTPQTISGIKTFSTQLKFTVATGTSPFTVSSTTVVSNLNADLLDGWHLSYILKDGYITSSASGLSSYWFKMWDITLNNQYLDVDINLLVHSAYNQLWGLISFRLRQNGTGTEKNIVSYLTEIVGNIPSDRFRLYHNNSSGLCLLWCNVSGLYNVYNYRVLAKTWRTATESPSIGTFYSGTFNAVQTIPSDSYTSITYLGILNNVASATKLLNARKINGTSFDGTSDITTAYWGTTRTISLTGAITGSVSTNGGGNITINTTYGTGNITNLDNRYVKKAGDTMLGHLYFASGKQTKWSAHGSSYISDGNVDSGTSLGGDLANLVISSWYGVSFTTSCSGQTYTNKTAVGINCRTGIVNAAKFVGTLLGNASTATQLQTARTINGTSFNGTANIVTSYWGTSRTLTIGNTGKSVNGSGNVSWSLSEIGAAAVNHTHNSILSKGNLNPQTGRTLNLGDVYSYNTVSGNTGAPTTYTSVIGFGRSVYGTVEIAGGWASSMGLWYRSLRDTTDNWYSWRPIIDSVNYTNYVKKIGTSSVGSTNVPIYLNGGTPAPCPWQFTGSTHQPIILYSGKVYRSGSTWYSDGITVSGAGTLSVSRSGALLKLTLSSGIITSATVQLDSTTSVPDGTSTSDAGGRSEGAFWFGVLVSKSHLVNIRAYYQGNKDNDSWLSYASAWTNFIYSITVTLIGYVG